MSLPDILLPYQQEWIADQAQVKTCEKSRRVGFSWCEAADDVLLAAKTREAGGMNVWYIGYNKDMALEFIHDCAFWAKHFKKAAEEIAIEEVLMEDEGKSILTFVIHFASGFRITALSSRPSNLRGKQGKVVIDEAAFHEDLSGLLKAAMALLMWGGRVVIISTHNGEDNPFNELINEIRAGKKPYSHHHIDLDEALEQGLYRRICASLGKEWSPEGEAKWKEDLVAFYGEHAEEELFCIPSKGSGLYFARILIESCMDKTIPVLRWSCKPEFATESDFVRIAACEEWIRENLAPVVEALDPNRPCTFGQDYGMTGDLSVVWPLQEQPGLIYRTPFLLELRNVPYQQQEQLMIWTGNHLPGFRGAAFDARGNGQPLAQRAMQIFGMWRVTQVMLTQEWYRDNMPRYKSAYEDKKIQIPADGDVLDDHRIITMQKGVAKPPESVRTKGRDGGQRHGDAAVAGCLAWFAATRTEGDTGVLDYYAGLFKEQAEAHPGYEELWNARFGDEASALKKFRDEVASGRS
jgi:phage FluMu gp28-like protein